VGKHGTEVFEFERTASRLIEMQGKDWLDAWATRHGQDPAAAAS
jgi:cell division protein ZapE